MYTQSYVLTNDPWSPATIPIPMGYAGTAGDAGTFGPMFGFLADDFASGKLGQLRVRGVVRVRKDSGTWVKGASIGWDSDGTGVDGKTGGAATSTTASKNFHVGMCLGTFGGAVEEADVLLGAFAPGTSITNFAQSVTGTTNGTLDLVPTSGSADSAFAGTLNKNFVEVLTKIHSIETALRDAGVIAYP